MKKLILILAITLLINVGGVRPGYCDVTYTITLSDEQAAVMELISIVDNNEFAINPGKHEVGALAWIQHKATWKANKLIDALIFTYSDKRSDKMSRAQKKAFINGFDMAKERRERRGGN